MTSVSDQTLAPNGAFMSFKAIQTAHSELLSRRRTVRLLDLKDAAIEFIQRTVEAGVYLERPHDRWSAQNLLDYWANDLYRENIRLDQTVLMEFSPELAPDLKDDQCPYLGLQAFDPDHRDLFYGRAELLNRAMEVLLKKPLLAVVGASGSGKSSFVLAGALPKLMFDTAVARKIFTPFVPGAEPLKGLARAMEPAGQIDEKRVEENARGMLASDTWLAEKVRALEMPVALVIDQFEEAFTMCDNAVEREKFISNLYHLVAGPQPIEHKVILTMRYDLVTRLARFPQFNRLIQESRLEVTSLSPEELREAIERPAEKVGLKFQEGVVEAIITDILGEPAGLPLLQFTLWKLWEKRERNRVLLETYKELGGARQALANSANKFFKELIIEKQGLAKRILLKLARLGEGQEFVSNRVYRSELYLTDPQPMVDEMLDQLLKARLIRESKETSQIQVAHESLLRNWPELVEWLEEQRDEMRKRQLLSVRAEDWSSRKQESSLLLRGVELEEAQAYRDLRQLEKEYVDASLQEATRRKKAELEQIRRAQRARRFTMAGAALFCLLALGLAFWRAFWEQKVNLLNAFEKEQQRFSQQKAEMSDVIKDLATKTNSLYGNIQELSTVTTQLTVNIQTLSRETNRLGDDVRRLSATTNELNGAVRELLSETNRLASQIKELTNELNITKGTLADANRREVEARKQAAESEAKMRAAQEAAALSKEIISSGSEIQKAELLQLRAVATSGIDALRQAIEAADIYARLKVAPTNSLLKLLHNLLAAPALVFHGIQTQSDVLAAKSDGNRLLLLDENGLAAWSPSNDMVTRASSNFSKFPLQRPFRADFSMSTKRAAILDTTNCHLINLETGKRVGTFGSSDTVFDVAFSPDGTMFATVSLDGAAILRNASDGSLKRVLSTNRVSGLTGVAFHPSENCIVATGIDGDLSFFDPNDLEGSKNRTEDLDEIGATAVSWNATGTQLALGYQDGAVRILKANPGGVSPFSTNYLSTNVLVINRALPAQVWRVRWHPRQNLVLGASYKNGAAKIWDASSGEAIVDFPGIDTNLRDATFLDAHGVDTFFIPIDLTPRLWSLTKPQRAMALPPSDGVGAGVAFSPNGKFIAEAHWGKAPGATVYALGSTNFSTELARVFSITNKGANGVAFNRDNTLLATGHDDGSVNVFEVPSGRLKWSQRIAEDPIHGLAFGPDDVLVAARKNDHVESWTRTGARVWEKPVHLSGDGSPRAVVWAADGKTVLVSTKDGDIRILDAATGDQAGSIGEPSVGAWGMAITPDGGRVALGLVDGRIAVWDIATKQRRDLKLFGDERVDSRDSIIYGVAISRDLRGRTLLAAGGSRSTIKLWDLDTWQELPFPGGDTRSEQISLKPAVHGVAFSPDGAFVACTSEKGATQIYYTDYDQLIREARALLQRGTER